MKRKLGLLRLSKVLGSHKGVAFSNLAKPSLRKLAHELEKRVKRISNTLSELRTQLTPQFTKSLGGVSGSAGKQAQAAQRAQGFTIVELTIATLIFSIILVVAMASFIGIGRVYYKGRSLTETQAIAQQVVSQTSADMQFASDIVTNVVNGTTGIPTGVGSQYVCFGNVRYTFNLYQKVDTDNISANHFGLLRDTMPGTYPCASPFGAGSIPFSSPTEVLSAKMRLSRFDITPSKNAAGGNVTDLWDLNVIVAYGDDEVLTNPGAANVACDSNLKSSQFCSVSRQTTSVSRGL